MNAQFRHFCHQNYMKAAYQMVCNTSSPVVHISEVDSKPSPLQQTSSTRVNNIQ